jgi:hypothetical protein
MMTPPEVVVAAAAVVGNAGLEISAGVAICRKL